MNTYHSKIQDSDSKAAAYRPLENSGVQMALPHLSTVSAPAQMKLKEKANSSLQVQQQKAIQRLADERRQSTALVQLQAKADQFSSSVWQKKENKTGLPNQLKSGVENLSGYSLDNVKVHYNSSAPKQFQAHAYAQGTDIHLAPGQEKHLPHETWHVVQQKQGRVKPTVQLNGKVGLNDDAQLEKEADVMGAKAVRTSAAQGLSSTTATPKIASTGTIQRNPTKSSQRLPAPGEWVKVGRLVGEKEPTHYARIDHRISNTTALDYLSWYSCITEYGEKVELTRSEMVEVLDGEPPVVKKRHFLDHPPENLADPKGSLTAFLRKWIHSFDASYRNRPGEVDRNQAMKEELDQQMLKSLHILQKAIENTQRLNQQAAEKGGEKQVKFEQAVVHYQLVLHKIAAHIHRIEQGGAVDVEALKRELSGVPNASLSQLETYKNASSLTMPHARTEKKILVPASEPGKYIVLNPMSGKMEKPPQEEKEFVILAEHPEWVILSDITHWVASQGRELLYAGHVKFSGLELLWWNNNTGHYLSHAGLAFQGEAPKLDGHPVLPLSKFRPMAWPAEISKPGRRNDQSNEK